MSVEKLLNTLRYQATVSNSNIHHMQIGKVTAFDPTNYLVTVQLLEATEDDPALQTGWIPLFSPWVGHGWGMFCPPNIGDLVEVHSQDGSIQNTIGCMRTFNDSARPLSVPSKEFWLVHESGSFIKLTNDGKLSLSSAIEIDLTAPIIKINSPDIRAGNLDSGTPLPLLTSDNNPTLNIKAT